MLPLSACMYVYIVYMYIVMCIQHVRTGEMRDIALFVLISLMELLFRACPC